MSDSDSGSDFEPEKEKKNDSSEESEQEVKAKKDDKKKSASKSKKPQSKKRKVESEEDDDVSAEEKEKTPPKKAKKSNKEEKSELPGSIDLGNNRFVNMNEFKGKNYIHIREYYRAADGKLAPTKKGLSFTPDQLKSLIAKIPEIEEKFL